MQTYFFQYIFRKSYYSEVKHSNSPQENKVLFNKQEVLIA